MILSKPQEMANNQETTAMHVLIKHVAVCETGIEELKTMLSAKKSEEDGLWLELNSLKEENKNLKTKNDERINNFKQTISSLEKIVGDLKLDKDSLIDKAMYAEKERDCFLKKNNELSEELEISKSQIETLNMTIEGLQTAFTELKEEKEQHTQEEALTAEEADRLFQKYGAGLEQKK